MIGFATDLSGIEEEDDLLQTLPTLGFEIPAEALKVAVARSDEDESGTRWSTGTIQIPGNVRTSSTTGG
jgi:hypothetical protein